MWKPEIQPRIDADSPRDMGRYGKLLAALAIVSAAAGASDAHAEETRSVGQTERPDFDSLTEASVTAFYDAFEADPDPQRADCGSCGSGGGSGGTSSPSPSYPSPSPSDSYDTSYDPMFDLMMALASACFVATVAFGTAKCPELDTLRDFRDRSLLKNAFGRKFIRFYYRRGPAVASWLERHRFSRRLVRSSLGASVWVLRILGFGVKTDGQVGLRAA